MPGEIEGYSLVETGHTHYGINVHAQSPRIDTGGYRAASRGPSPGDAEIASNTPNAKHYIYVREAVEAKEQSWFSFTTRYVQGRWIRNQFR